MNVDVEGDLYRYCEQKKVVPRFTSYGCDFCQKTFDASLLNLVTLKSGLFFGCRECCEKVLLIDGWQSMTYEKVLDVLGV